MVVEERKKREWERPTDRRMRPGEVFNWEEGWNFASLGAVSPSVDGRRNTVLPAQLSPFQDMSLLHALSPPLPLVGSDVLRAVRGPGGKSEYPEYKKKAGHVLIPVFPVSRVNPGGRARSRVLDRPAVFHEEPHRSRLGNKAAMRNLLKQARLP